jgi:ribonuclease D
LSADERDIPLVRIPDSAHKKRLRDMQDAVAAESTRFALGDGVLASRRTLEVLLDGNGWPAALEGWRRPILEPVLQPILDAQSG